MSLNELRQMDLLSFRSLHDSCVRLDLADRITEAANLRVIVHDHQGSSFEGLIKDLIDKLNGFGKGPKIRTEKTKQDFVKRFGGKTH